MYLKIQDQCEVNLLDVLGYADDLLVICTSLSQLRRVITAIKPWCLENNLLLNPKKSGIVEFVPRLGMNKYYLSTGTTFEGIPAVEE